MRRIVSLMIIITAAWVTIGCEESGGPDLREQRFVYYCIGGNTPASSSGFFRYNLKDAARERLDDRPTEYCTHVASNGVVVFETKEGFQKLFGVCEDGSILAVPFPEGQIPKTQFRYALPPRADLSANGHFALYPVERIPPGAEQPFSRTSMLALFDCSKWMMTLINADSIITQHMAYLGATKGYVYGNAALLSGDGSTVWFTGLGVRIDQQPDTVGYAIYQWRKDEARPMTAASSEVFKLLGYNARSNSLTFQLGSNPRNTSLRVLDFGTFEYQFEAEVDLTPLQFGRDFDALASWENDGITIRKASDGSMVWRILEKTDMEETFGERYGYWNENYIGISPDCYWLTFTLTRADEPQYCDLFAVRDNGQDLVRLAERVPHGYPTISSRLGR